MCNETMMTIKKEMVCLGIIFISILAFIVGGKIILEVEIFTWNAIFRDLIEYVDNYFMGYLLPEQIWLSYDMDDIRDMAGLVIVCHELQWLAVVIIGMINKIKKVTR